MFLPFSSPGEVVFEEGDCSIVSRLPERAREVIGWWGRTEVVSAFPTISVFVTQIVAMLPASSAEVERSFSHLSHIQSNDRLNMSDRTFEALCFVYSNKDFCMEIAKLWFTDADLCLLHALSAREARSESQGGTPQVSLVLD